MKGEQIMKRVSLREYAEICRASRRGNLIARLKVRNVEVECKGNELVKLVAKEIREKGDFSKRFVAPTRTSEQPLSVNGPRAYGSKKTEGWS